jgi:hypothetical protein
MVQSEHIRGERRVYFVVDRYAPDDSRGTPVPGTQYTEDKRTAERACARLNAPLRGNPTVAERRGLQALISHGVAIAEDFSTEPSHDRQKEARDILAAVEWLRQFTKEGR